ncbi:MAG: carbohydrate ABC transporter permease, partial [Pseudomonadota bacterium]
MSTIAEPFAPQGASRESLSVTFHRLGKFGRLALTHALLLSGVVFVMLPIIWMLLTSMKPGNEIFSAGLDVLPKNPQPVENYTYALTSIPLMRMMLNGAIVCGGILIVQLLTSIPCAYALAKIKFRAAPWVFSLVLLGLCIPIQVPALPLYLALANL